MGTATNQIATRADINSGKRKTAYYKATSESDDSLKKCPTKGEIDQIEFLDVKNKSTSTTENNTYSYVSGLNWTNSMGVGPNNSPVESINITGTPYVVSNTNYSFILTNTSPGYYYHTSTSSAFNIKFNNSAPTASDINSVKSRALWSKTIQTAIGKRTQVKISLSTVGYAATQRITDYYNSTLICSATPVNVLDVILYAYVFDTNNELIYNTSIDKSNLNNALLTFTPTTSSVTVYLVPMTINLSFTPKVTGNLYVGIGFNSTITKTTYNSYYDNDCKLALYKDIGEDSARKFGVYYGVWNNKSTTARVDYAKVLINTTPDTFATGWTEIGGVTLSDIAGPGYRSGVITCTLPTNVNLATTQYYLVVKVGDTLNNQDFYGGWGNAKEDANYTYCRKSTSGWTPAVPLTPTSSIYKMNGESYNSVDNKGVLNNIDLYDGSATLNTGVYNTNPENKGWIQIQ
jgi:hypothetical protein